VLPAPVQMSLPRVRANDPAGDERIRDLPPGL